MIQGRIFAQEVGTGNSASLAMHQHRTEDLRRRWPWQQEGPALPDSPGSPLDLPLTQARGAPRNLPMLLPLPSRMGRAGNRVPWVGWASFQGLGTWLRKGTVGAKYNLGWRLSWTGMREQSTLMPPPLLSFLCQPLGVTLMPCLQQGACGPGDPFLHPHYFLQGPAAPTPRPGCYSAPGTPS